LVAALLRLVLGGQGGVHIRPTDIFIPGCPVRPEALIDGFLKLSAKIKAERIGWCGRRRAALSAPARTADDMQKGEYTYEVPKSEAEPRGMASEAFDRLQSLTKVVAS